MMWRYTVSETRALLTGVLMLAGAFGLFLGESYPGVDPERLTGSAVGVGAGVAENEVNTRTLALLERERALDQRAAQLETEGGETGSQRLPMVFTSVVGLLLLGLILLNFYLDGVRRGTVVRV